jgi:NDP-sugar pyrophosphorylase family protein
MLPTGTQTLIERVLSQIANSGLKEVDLVVSDQPEELRKLVGQGERWGLRVTWHWVQSEVRSYASLRSFDWQGIDKVVFARAEHWISDRALTQIIESENLALVRADQPNVWTGWASCSTALLDKMPAAGSAAEAGAIFQSHSQMKRKIMQREDWFAPACAQDMLALQQRSLSDEGLSSAPATWIRKPWGVMSPQAWVDPQAQIRGPAIIGPGCFVCAEAQIGPNTVLTKDVIVDSEVRIADTLAMPDVYFGHKTELRHTLVNGHRVMHTKTRTSSQLPDIRAVRNSGNKDLPQTGLISRGMAAALLVAFAPVAAVDWIVRKAYRLPPRWQTQPVVHGYLARNAGLRVHLLNVADPQQGLTGQCLAQYGLLLDIAHGKRHWFGVRTRTMGQWQQLSTDWQSVLARAPVGLIHASAWHEPGQLASTEAQAAADVFFAVSPNWKTRLRMCMDLLRQSSTALSNASFNATAKA